MRLAGQAEPAREPISGIRPRAVTRDMARLIPAKLFRPAAIVLEQTQCPQRDNLVLAAVLEEESGRSGVSYEVVRVRLGYQPGDLVPQIGRSERCVHGNRHSPTREQVERADAVVETRGDRADSRTGAPADVGDSLSVHVRQRAEDVD